MTVSIILYHSYGTHSYYELLVFLDIQRKKEIILNKHIVMPIYGYSSELNSLQIK